MHNFDPETLGFVKGKPNGPYCSSVMLPTKVRFNTRKDLKKNSN